MTNLALKYRADIDGIRAVAVIAVVLYHAFPKIIKGGFIGVDIFFVLSGYLISTIIFENLNNKKFSYINFYCRRIKRIFPALIIVLLATLSFGWLALSKNEYYELGKQALSSTLFYTNFLLIDQAGYFDKASISKPLLHLWSLSI